MWSFLKTIEFLFVAAFILGFLAKGLGGIFKAVQTFLKAAEPTLRMDDKDESAEAKEPAKTNPEANPNPIAEPSLELIHLLEASGYVKDGKLDVTALEQAIAPPLA
jgi:hypothetical protein